MTTDSPFAPVLSRESFLETLGAAEALRRLDDGLGAREPFLLVTGEPGMGKSALANRAIARWGSRVNAAYLAFPVSTGAELMEEILRRWGAACPDGASRSKLFAGIEGALTEIVNRGQVAMIVVDDAHHLSRELLEELRLLVNAAQQARRPLEVLLAGLPSLEATLEDASLAALRQRVSARARLEPLSPGETRRYIRHRVTASGDDRSNLFPRKTCAEIAVVSRGVPRQINAIAGEALRMARDAGHPTVEPSHVRAAVAALSGVLPKDESKEAPELVAEAAAPAAKPLATPAPTPLATPAPAPLATPAPTPLATPAPTPLAAAAPTPVLAPPPTPAVRPGVPANVALPEIVPEPEPAPLQMASQDPKEWVARFVGDKGPLQIGSQAAARTSWTPLEPELELDAAKPSTGRIESPVGNADEWSPSARTHGANALKTATTALLAAVVLITLIVLGLRAGKSSSGHETKATGAAMSAGVAPQHDGGNDSSAPAKGSRATRTDAEKSSAERSADGEAPQPRPPYTLDAGVSMELERALDEREHMQALTGIQGWVVPVSEPGSEKYDVVLGIFRSYSRAKAAAEMLMRSRTLPNVKVVTLPPKSTRQ